VNQGGGSKPRSLIRAAFLTAVLIGGPAVVAQAEEPEEAAPEVSEPGGEPASAAPEAAPPAKAGEQPVQPGEWLPGKFSSAVALTSNYMSRGITQTDNDPAIQGSIEYTLETGLLGTSAYLRGFGSNAKLRGDTDTSTVELDALFGIRGDIGDTGLSWDLGGAYYSYPGTRSADHFDYWEIPLILTYKATDWLTLQFSNYYSPDYQFSTGHANYSSGLITVKMPVYVVGWQLFGGTGYQYIAEAADGTDWTLGTILSIKGIDFTVAYVDTNYHARQCGGNNQCDAKAIFTVGAQF
jgi:uncharacterized protein (TIGR02001 family)